MQEDTNQRAVVEEVDGPEFTAAQKQYIETMMLERLARQATSLVAALQ